MSAFWRALTTIRDGLRNHLQFETQGEDTTPPLTADAIVIRKLISDKPGEPAKTNETMPGILVCPGSRVSRPPEAGTNERDDAIYPILCQIIAKDQSDKVNNLQTYLMWQSQVARYLNHLFAANQVIDNDADFGLYDSFAIEVDVVDESRWVKHANFVSGVLVHVLARETRGVT